MKLMIDIPKKTFEEIQERTIITCGETFAQKLVKYIRNGTPLPEHHGRLIDADAFQRYCFNKNFDKRLSEGGLATINMFLEFQPTIIEGSDSE